MYVSSRSAVLVSAAIVAVIASQTVAPSPVHAQAAGPAATVGAVVESFDGTPIVANLFTPAGASGDEPVPLVLATHGWAGTGSTEPTGLLGRLVDEGYAVLTWDQRGFGCSGGQVRIDDPQVEGRDVSALIDWAVEEIPVLERDGDPVVGMTGGSYAGGIQTAAASIDPRIDALAPEISWSDLRYSLNPGGVVKQGWVTLLYLAGLGTADTLGLSPDCPGGPQSGGLDPAIHQGLTEFLTTGSVSEQTLDFFAGSSLAAYGTDAPVDVPTLVANGSVDTLFNVADGLGVYQHVLAQGAPSRYIVFCGGHVSCPASYADADDGAFLDDAVMAWFAEHLLGEQVEARPRFEYRTNDGMWRSLSAFPTVDDGAVTVDGRAEDLVVVPVLDLPDVRRLATDLTTSGGTLPANPLTAAAASSAADPRAATFELAAAGDEPLVIVGVPEVTLTVEGTLIEGLDALPADQLSATLDSLTLAGLEPVTDALGRVVGAVPVAGGLLQGTLGTVIGTSPADVMPSAVNLFVKLVHRETGEVLNLQEGAVAAGLLRGPVTVDVPMPGLAYTVPAGHHVDLQVSTASLAHATGRLPAVVDVGVQAAVPVRNRPGPSRPAAPEQSRRPESPGRPDAAGTAVLPATGGGGPDAGAVSLLLVAGALATAAVAASRRAEGNEERQP